MNSIPTMAVVGRDGTIAFVQGGDDTLLENAVAKAPGSPAKERARPTRRRAEDSRASARAHEMPIARRFSP